jgi:hypothetical protein
MDTPLDRPRSANAVPKLVSVLNGLGTSTIDMRGHRLDPSTVLSTKGSNDVLSEDLLELGNLSSLVAKEADLENVEVEKDAYFVYGSFVSEDNLRYFFVGKMLANTSSGCVWTPHSIVSVSKRGRNPKVSPIVGENVAFIPYVRSVGDAALQANIVTGRESDSLILNLSGLKARPLRKNLRKAFQERVEKNGNQLHQARRFFLFKDNMASGMGYFRFLPKEGSGSVDLSRLMRYLDTGSMDDFRFTPEEGDTFFDQLPTEYINVLKQDSLIAVGYRTGFSSPPDVGSTLRISDRLKLREGFPAKDGSPRTMFLNTPTPFIGRPVSYGIANVKAPLDGERFVTVRPLMITAASRYSVQSNAPGSIEASFMNLPNVGYRLVVKYDKDILSMDTPFGEDGVLDLDALDALTEIIEGKLTGDESIDLAVDSIDQVQYNELSMMGDEVSLSDSVLPLDTENVVEEFNKSPFSKASTGGGIPSNKRLLSNLESIGEVEDNPLSQITKYGSLALMESMNELVKRFQRVKGRTDTSVFPFLTMRLNDTEIDLQLGTLFNFTKVTFVSSAEDDFRGSYMVETNYGANRIGPIPLDDLTFTIQVDLNAYVAYFARVGRRALRTGLGRPNVRQREHLGLILSNFRYLLASVCSLQHDVRVYRDDDGNTVNGEIANASATNSALPTRTLMCDAVAHMQSVVMEANAMGILFSAPKRQLEALASTGPVSRERGAFVVDAWYAHHRSRPRTPEEAFERDAVSPPPSSMFVHQYQVNAGSDIPQGLFSSTLAGVYQSRMMLSDEEGAVEDLEDAGEFHAEEDAVDEEELQRMRAEEEEEQRRQEEARREEEEARRQEEEARRQEEEDAQREREEEEAQRKAEEEERRREEEARRREKEEERRRRTQERMALEDEAAKRLREEKKRRAVEKADREADAAEAKRLEAQARKVEKEAEATRRAVEEAERQAQEKVRLAEEKQQREEAEAERWKEKNDDHLRSVIEKGNIQAERVENEVDDIRKKQGKPPVRWREFLAIALLESFRLPTINFQTVEETERSTLAESTIESFQKDLQAKADVAGARYQFVSEFLERMLREEGEEEMARQEEEERARVEEERRQQEEESDRLRKEKEREEREAEEARLAAEEAARKAEEEILRKKAEEEDARRRLDEKRVEQENLEREREEKERAERVRVSRWFEEENAWRTERGLPPLPVSDSTPSKISPGAFFTSVRMEQTRTSKVVRGIVSKTERFAIPLRPYPPRKRSFMSTMDQMEWRLSRTTDAKYPRGIEINFIPFTDEVVGLEGLFDQTDVSTFRAFAPFRERRILSATGYLGERSVPMSAVGATFGKKTGKVFRATVPTRFTLSKNLRRVPAAGLIRVSGTDARGDSVSAWLDYTFFPKMINRTGSVEGRIFSVNDGRERNQGKPFPLARVHIKARMNSDDRTCSILSLVVCLNQNTERVRRSLFAVREELENEYRAGRFGKTRPRLKAPPPIPRRRVGPSADVVSPFPKVEAILPATEGELPSLDMVQDLLFAASRLAKNLYALSVLTGSESTRGDYRNVQSALDEADSPATWFAETSTELKEAREQAEREGTTDSDEIAIRKMNELTRGWEGPRGLVIQRVEEVRLQVGEAYATNYQGLMSAVRIDALGGIPLRQVTFLNPLSSRPRFFPQRAAMFDELARISGAYTEEEWREASTDLSIVPANTTGDWPGRVEGFWREPLEMGRRGTALFYIRDSDAVIFAPTDLETPVTLGSDPSRYVAILDEDDDPQFYRVSPPFPEDAGESGKGKEPDTTVRAQIDQQDEEWEML